MEKKVCRLCKIEKSIDEFGIMKSSKDGRNIRCRECANLKAREYDKKKKVNMFIDNGEKKMCAICRTYKTLDNFGLNYYVGDGISSNCEECVKKNFK